MVLHYPNFKCEVLRQDFHCPKPQESSSECHCDIYDLATLVFLSCLCLTDAFAHVCQSAGTAVSSVQLTCPARSEAAPQWCST